jgi:carboxymethylenebutenolidase
MTQGTEGVSTRWDTLTVGGDPMPLYVAMPEGDGPFPAVIVNQGLGSVEHVIQVLTERVAAAGFVAAAPLYYHRQKDNILEEVKAMPPGSPERVKLLFGKVDQLRDDEVIADGLAAVEHLQGFANVNADSVGVVGFCLGGHITWLQTTAIGAFKASAPFYPSNLWSAWGDFPTVFERSVGIKCPVMGSFGSEDTNPSPDDMAKLDAELTRLGVEHEFHAYPAGHDFQNFSAARYSEAAATASWPVVMDFLHRHLG